MKHLVSSITLLLLSTLAFGQVPNTFSSGETISSSKINANFAHLANAIKNDDIIAMMVCTNSGKLNENINGAMSFNTEFVYFGCYSTDEEQFEKSVVNQLYPNDLIGNSSNNSSTEFIRLKNLFVNKWILYESYMLERSGSIIQNHIFYKVSSD